MESLERARSQIFDLGCVLAMGARDRTLFTLVSWIRVEVLKPVGVTRVWVPGALVQGTPYQQTLANTFNAPGGKARFVERQDDARATVRIVGDELDGVQLRARRRAAGFAR